MQSVYVSMSERYAQCPPSPRKNDVGRIQEPGATKALSLVDFITPRNLKNDEFAEEQFNCLMQMGCWVSLMRRHSTLYAQQISFQTWAAIVLQHISAGEHVCG